MLVVHWSPVKNTKNILRNGIRKTKRGLFCFPLTGHVHVDRWWAQAFRSWEPRTQYNGFVFRITQGDLPATFDHWGLAEKSIFTVDELSMDLRERIAWWMALEQSGNHHEELQEQGKQLVEDNPGSYNRYVKNALNMRWCLEDNEIILSRAITAKRIIRVIPGSQKSGRQRLKTFRYSKST